MKLRNKKTGEIIEVESLVVNTDGAIQMTYIDEECNRELYITGYLKTFTNDFEDYEEPKKHYFITEYGKVFELNEIDKNLPDSDIRNINCVENIEDYQYIGNYFDTEEEAEKAVEKLKAWKRLKDNGFKIKGWKFTPDMKNIEGNYVKIEAEIPAILINESDLDLLFGGEDGN